MIGICSSEITNVEFWVALVIYFIIYAPLSYALHKRWGGIREKLAVWRNLQQEGMGLVIVIEPHGTYAIYEQIVNQIRNQIISGELQPDEALPSIRGLAADIGVSVITTKHAYEELEREGLIRSVSNKGFYVCKYNTDYLHEKQLMELEKRLQEWITLAKQAGLGTEDIREMLEGLL